MAQRPCECIVHRYHVFHVTPDGEVWSHSQNSCDALSAYERRAAVLAADVPVREYRHDLTRDEAKSLYAKYQRVPQAEEASIG